MGLGVLGFSSADFWALTLREYEAALEGYAMVNGRGKSKGPSSKAVRELKRFMEEMKAKGLA